MPNQPSSLFEVQCPCCHATLKVDPATQAVITYQQQEDKPHLVEDLTVAVQRLKGEAARREDAFQKSFAEHKSRKDVLNKKFDELLKQAKEEPVDKPPARPFDLD